MTIRLNSRPIGYVAPQSAVEILGCKMLFKLMLKGERIHIAFGDDGKRPTSRVNSEFVLAPPRFWTTVKLMLAPNLWVGESFTAGFWYLKKGNLSEFLRVLTKDARIAFKKYYQFMATLRGVHYYLGQYLLNSYYTRKVRRHYEVDSKIYEMILDDELVYTCAFFANEHESLGEAQRNKLAAAISRMELPSGRARVLDIGCGWGATARALVKYHPSVNVCGLSISESQIEWAKQKDLQSLAARQCSRIEYRLEDYADHDRVDWYDAISVIGMI
jgi:cyclopropane-fatty-acyl-phospholipid synthase